MKRASAEPPRRLRRSGSASRARPSATRSLFDQLGITEAEERLVRIDPGYATASTASRVDAFLLPDGLHFAEYNAESPAGTGYTQRLAELFDDLPVMDAVSRSRTPSGFTRRSNRCSARFSTATANGADARSRQRRDRGLARGADLDRVRDPARRVHRRRRSDDHQRSRAIWSSTARLCRADGHRIDLVYRRVLINDILERPDECAALVRAYEIAGGLRREHLPVQAAAQEGVLRRPRPTRSNARMFTPMEHAVIAAHVPWTRVVADVSTEKDGVETPLLELAAASATRSC